MRLSLNARGSGTVGEMTTLITRAFAAVEEQAPITGSGDATQAIILLIDEADALAQSREADQMHHEDRAGVNALIRGIDTISTQRRPVIMVLCTNRLDALDPAIRRRAFGEFAFTRPGATMRVTLLAQVFHGIGFDEQQIAELAQLTGKNGRSYPFTYSRHHHAARINRAAGCLRPEAGDLRGCRRRARAGTADTAIHRGSVVSNKVDLHEILTKHQTAMLANLDLGRTAFGNAEMKGDATESQWLRVIDDFLPGRYQCTAAKVIDCRGDTSDFIDVVIHDRHYCPLLFELGGQKYIPAESVYAAFEVTQELTKGDIEYAAEKGASVRRLRRTNIAFRHAGGIQEPRPLFPILTGILTTQSGWSPPFGDAFHDAIRNTAGEQTRLDMGCALRHGTFDIDWTGGVDAAITFSESEASLMFFLLRLFGRLQALGTVPAIDLAAYGQSLEAAATR